MLIPQRRPGSLLIGTGAGRHRAVGPLSRGQAGRDETHGHRPQQAVGCRLVPGNRSGTELFEDLPVHLALVLDEVNPGYEALTRARLVHVDQ